MNALTLRLLPETYAIYRLSPEDEIPSWAKGAFVSITRSCDELSIVCPQSDPPQSHRCELNWRCFRVSGTLDFSIVGIIASISAVLASAEISIFVVSSFDTDYILIREDDIDRASRELNNAGFKTLL